tara:strand:- start:1071 stop:1610 length:540 start_codon:yes stop_codon:yes gene_type:complete
MKLKNSLENNNISLKSIVSNKLTNIEIKQICLLKDKQWKFGIKSQLEWFKNNIKKFDLHNLLYIKSRLVGYTLLRKRTCKIENLKNTYYLLFDTLVIDKKNRGKKLSDLLMCFNNVIIKRSGFISFLICSNELLSFYEKNNWTKLNKKVFNVPDHPFLSNGMVFNKKKNIKRFIFYINS